VDRQALVMETVPTTGPVNVILGTAPASPNVDALAEPSHPIRLHDFWNAASRSGTEAAQETRAAPARWAAQPTL
jgi:hypothetical protein